MSHRRESLWQFNFSLGVAETLNEDKRVNNYHAYRETIFPLFREGFIKFWDSFTINEEVKIVVCFIKCLHLFSSITGPKNFANMSVEAKQKLMLTWLSKVGRFLHVRDLLPSKTEWIAITQIWLPISYDGLGHKQSSVNKLQLKHKHKQNHPNIPSCFGARSVIWNRIECFRWPNITKCFKYHCACVIPEQYFVFNCCSGKGKHKRKHRKKEKD